MKSSKNLKFAATPSANYAPGHPMYKGIAHAEAHARRCGYSSLALKRAADINRGIVGK